MKPAKILTFLREKTCPFVWVEPTLRLCERDGPDDAFENRIFLICACRSSLLTLYQKFKQVCVLTLTALIAIIIVLALWNLTLKILLSI